MMEQIVNEDVIRIESDRLVMEIGKHSASIKSVKLKDHQDNATHAHVSFGDSIPVLVTTINGRLPRLELKSTTRTRATWAIAEESAFRDLSISIGEDPSLFYLELTPSSQRGGSSEESAKFTASWSRAEDVQNRYNVLETIVKTEKTGPWQREYLVYREGMKTAVDVPRETHSLVLSERYFCHALELDDQFRNLVEIRPSRDGVVSVSINPVFEADAVSLPYRLVGYIGSRDFFSLKRVGLEDTIHVGMLGQIGLVLILVINWIAALTQNYGVAIILLSVLVTVLLAPLTLVSIRSMKKMQELQPKLDQLKKKYDKEPQKLNREMMALFKEHRVSPLSGCLPMLLQMPVFFALWSAVSHMVELRGASFLWIKDLSLPDRLAELPFGLELNILPVLMAIAMFVQTKLSQPKVATQAPSAAMLSGPIMPVIFCLLFYNVPSGLVLYWLTNSTVSAAWYKLAKT